MDFDLLPEQIEEYGLAALAALAEEFSLEDEDQEHECDDYEGYTPISKARIRVSGKRSRAKPGSFEKWVDDVIFGDKSLECSL